MIKLDKVTKIFGTGSTALSDITLEIEPGEFVFLVGPSGSGKSTLMRMLIRETLPTSGSIQVNNIDLVKLPNNKVPHLRRKIGVIFQDLKLLVDRTIYENIVLPLEMSNVPHKEAHAKVLNILEQVGISEHKDKYPVQLSGGELQRAAIARALIFQPDLLLADEPTGNLDTATSWEIVKLLQDINKSGTTVIMATHNTDIVNSLLKRVIALEKGSLTKDTKEVKPKHKDESTEKEEKVEKEEKTEKDEKKEAKEHTDEKEKTKDVKEKDEKEKKEAEKGEEKEAEKKTESEKESDKKEKENDK